MQCECPLRCAAPSGRGNEFIATAHIIRAGSKVTVARMELHNEEGTHIAFGTGTYLVG